MMKKILLILFVLCCIRFSAYSQRIDVVVSSAKGCKGDTITSSVDVTGFSNVCAVGVRVKYDTTILKFVNIVNINKELQQAAFAEVKGFVTLGWFSSTPDMVANFVKGKLYDMKFIYLNPIDTEIKVVEDASVASDCNLKHMDMAFTNAKISPKKNCKK